jgi:hypothetical protein
MARGLAAVVSYLMAQLFRITHDDLTLDEYTSTVIDGGNLAATAAAALVGAGGMSVLINDITSTLYRWRCYIDPNGLTIAASDAHFVCGMYRTDPGGQRGRIRLRNTGGSYSLRADVSDDGGTTQSTAEHVITDDVHYAEVLVEYASSAVANDGRLTFWIDGIEKEQVVGIDLFDRSKPNRGILGAISSIDAGTSGTYYLDDFIANDDGTEIGAAGDEEAGLKKHYWHIPIWEHLT